LWHGPKLLLTPTFVNGNIGATSPFPWKNGRLGGNRNSANPEIPMGTGTSWQLSAVHALGIEGGGAYFPSHNEKLSGGVFCRPLE
jgi:hypothetical protein